MNNLAEIRVDEVDKHYKSIKSLGHIQTYLFWAIAILSLLMPYSASIVTTPYQSTIKTIFIVMTLIYFVLSQISRVYLIPRAEHMRRKQLLSDSFGVPLSSDRTSLYYNNNYAPSLQRLAANTMENAFFSKEVSAEMLQKSRLIIGGYLIIWLLAFSLRHNNLDVLTWITQLVFSGEIVVKWLKLEVLRSKSELTYDQLHSHFLNEIGEKSAGSIVSVLNAFVAYEAAKSSAGLLLSSKVFHKLNPSLSEKWNRIRHGLKMHSQ